METIRALASVLELNPDDLIGVESSFEVYQHTQRADHIFIAVFVVFNFVIAIQSVTGTINLAGNSLLAVVLAGVTFLFHSLTIEVNEHFVSWYFGPGFWKKRIPLKVVSECQSVQNPILWGFGIRNFGPGWLYNVSGLQAVELCLDSGAIIRLGTDEPNYLKVAIDEAKCNLL